MKHNLSRTTLAIVFLSLLHVSLSPATRAQGGGHCSSWSVAGKWGYTYTGSILLPTGPVPVASVGQFTLDAQGNVSGTQTRNNGGSSAKEYLTGTVSVNPDCTATGTINVAETEFGPVVRSAVLAFVFVENSGELRAIFESLTLTNGPSLPVVITVNGKQLFNQDKD
jgi:hypothetical protein